MRTSQSATTSHEFKWSLSMACVLEDKVILAGASSHEFSPDVLAGPDSLDANVYFNHAKSDWQARCPIYDFLLVFAKGDQNPLLRMTVDGKIWESRLNVEKLPAALVGVSNIAPALRSQLLHEFEPLSDAWHLLVRQLPPNFLEDVDSGALESNEAFILDELKNILPQYSPDGYLAFIDGFDGQHVSGWVKKIDSDDPVSIDVYQDASCLAGNFRASAFRKDIYDAGLGTGSYSFSLPAIDAPGRLICFRIMHAESGKLIGFRLYSAACMPLDAKCRLQLEETKPDLRGWCVDEERNNRLFVLDILLNGIIYGSAQTRDGREDLLASGLSAGQGGFHIASPLPYLPSGAWDLCFQVANGSFSRHYEYEIVKKSDPLPDLSILNKQISIIIPVYNAPEDLQACLQSLFAHNLGRARIIIVDDCSPDPAIDNLLEKYAHDPRVTILRNEKNLGFSGSINRGIEAAGRDDVILLNSDTRVTPKWLESLLLTSISRPRVGTVTPMSDRAGAFSAPEQGNNNLLPPGASEDEFAIAFRRASAGALPSVPTGNGFCMYVSRECLDDTGLFDQEAFPRGYGEENDFCMRAARRGWLHLIDDRTYIYHESGKSFKDAKKELLDHGMAVLKARYPEYRSSLGVFAAGGPLLTARYCARVAQAQWRHLNRRRILYVISTTKGGTPLTNRDLMDEIGQCCQCYLLQSDGRELKLFACEEAGRRLIRRHALQNPVDPFTHISREYDAYIAAWLFELDIDLVHIRHFLWHSLNLAEVASRLGCKVVYSMHDYYTLSPNHNLVDDAGVYGGDDFAQVPSIYRASLWRMSGCGHADLPEGDSGFTAFWRRRFQDKIRACDAYVTTSQSARQTLLAGLENLDQSKFCVIPHGRNFKTFHNLAAKILPGEKLRILVPGNINHQKGLGFLLNLAIYDKLHYDCLEFHILGECPSAAGKYLVQHGAYDRQDMPLEIAKINPHAGAVFSIWNETWCHTLTELWASGLPAFVFDTGTLTERMRQCEGGWILPMGDIPETYQAMLDILRSDEKVSRALSRVGEWQESEGLVNNRGLMASRYLNLYANLLAGRQARGDSPGHITVGICGAHGVASSHVRLFNFTRNSSERPVTYLPMSGAALLQSVKLGLLDAVILQRTFLPRILAHELVEELAKRNVPYAYELDDNLLQVPRDKDSLIYMGSRAYLEKLLANATTVLVPNPVLRSKILPFNDHVRIYETRLDRFIWEPAPPSREPDGFLRALYYGTTTHLKDLLLILPALKQFAEKHPDFRLLLVGIGDNVEKLTSECAFIETAPISAKNGPYPQFVEYLLELCRKVDFGIAPLEDTVFNLTKSPLKLLEYGALGLPCVASNGGPYRDMGGIPGLELCENTTGSWLYGLEKTRRRIQRGNSGHEIRDFIIQNYFMTTADELAYDELIRGMLELTSKAQAGRKQDNAHSARATGF